MTRWRICLSMLLCVCPLYLIAIEEHLAHRVIWAIISMDLSLFGIALAQGDGSKRTPAPPSPSHKES